MHGRTIALLAVSALGPLLLLHPSEADAAPPEGRRGSMPAVVKADRDGDGVFDDLEARLAGRAGSSEVDVVVLLRHPATATRVSRIRRETGGFDVGRRFSIVPAFSARVAASQVWRLARRGGVVHVEEDSVVRSALDAAQASFGTEAARVDAGVDGDADGDPSVYSKDDLVAAIIDSGIDPNHLDLDEGKVLAFKDFLLGSELPYDDHGHGTTVASVLAGDGDGDARYRGVAPGAALVGVKVLDRNGAGTIAGVTAALDWVVANRAAYGIEVANLSLQTSSCSNGADTASLAVDAAEAAGLVVTAAAGNLGPGSCTVPAPGAAAGALTVGAMAGPQGGGFHLAAFSGRGPTLDGRTKPDLVAPGVNVTAALSGTASGYGSSSGTSLSAPFVAGVALLMLDANPALTPAGVRSLLTSTAIDWGAPGHDVEYGAGRLDGYEAVEAALGAEIGSGPPVPGHVAHGGTLAGTGEVAEHALELGGPAFPLAATLILPGVAAATSSSPDFDLELVDPSGAVVATSSTTSRQERITYLSPAAGSYRLRVRSKNGSGSYVLDASADLATLVLPSNVQPPEIAGTARDGETLTASDGVWSGGTALTFLRRWDRCDALGGSCAPIPGATGSSLDVTVEEVGSTVRVAVTAVGSAGSVTAVSPPTPTVEAAPPVNLVLPAIAGDAREGGVLTSTEGDWAGTAPIATTTQWQRCGPAGGDCTPIPEATSSVYTAVAADIGSTLRAVVAARNAGGSASAISAPTSPVTGRTEPEAKPPRIRGATASVRGRKVVARARILSCRQCRVELRIRFRGSWHAYRMWRTPRRDSPALAGRHHAAFVRDIPVGMRRWFVHAEDGRTGATARTKTRRLSVGFHSGRAALVTIETSQQFP